MNGQVLDDPIGELAVDSPVIVDTVPIDVVAFEEGQDRPLVSIPGVGYVYGVITPAFWEFVRRAEEWQMVEREEAQS